MPKSSKKSGGLGRGLDALIKPSTVEKLEQQANSPEAKGAVEIETSKIEANPGQPRIHFTEDSIQVLVESVKQYGVIQPIVVTKRDDGYQLVAGERRWRAAQLAGLEKVPAVIKDYSTEEVTEIALVENLQRQNLDPIEEAYGYRRLMDTFKQTQEYIADRVGRSRSHVANMMRLLQLPEFIRNDLSVGEITIGQARPLLSLKKESLQREAWLLIKEKDLNARQIEKMVKQMLLDSEKGPKVVPVAKEPNADVVALTDKLKVSLGLPVAIRLKAGKKVKGKIEVTFNSEEEFEHLMMQLTGEDNGFEAGQKDGEAKPTFHV